MGLRERRLTADAMLVEEMLREDGPIRILERHGTPPDRYKLEYLVPGLTVQNGEILPADRHLVEVYLTLAYPRQAPQCRMLTPVFHPNIAPHAICIGDHWSAGESLSAMLVRITEMICYQSYNVRSPLNGDAARWADQHAGELPLSRSDFSRWVRLSAGMSRQPSPQAEPIPPSPLTNGADPPRSMADADGQQARQSRKVARVPAGERILECGSCRASLTLPAGWDGPWARCPICGRMIQAASLSS